ncbi:dynamin family protein [Metabacillus iocasae]|uniref:GTPase n=1 Tax=Priestia iocasae TaxID=2291674 RepID=A0ABS2QUV1_9BACI|nr:dynamin family protein [Metabacillus iocasae]MBM7703256.1 putative GTPase [Metabacillus iocasae]
MRQTKEPLIDSAKQSIASSLFHLHTAFQEEEDLEQAYKTIQLEKKWIKSEFVIAFCGHFSAGKSSMINELVGHPLLPASPIPTSANLVAVKAGDEHATIHYRKGECVRYNAPYDFEKIKRFCLDGDEVEAIHLSVDTQKLPANVVVMDTPGIDSTDDAHRVSTESALHLADVIFYVMDYNHVQAELNLQFTKELQNEKKRLFLIVNQVDKHRDEELSFQAFQQSVSDSFAKWNVKPERIFYTSLKDEACIYNELPQLKAWLQELMIEQKNRKPNIQTSMQKLISQHVAFLREKQEEGLTVDREIVQSRTESERNEVHTQLAQLQEQLNTLTQQEKQLEQTYVNETRVIIQHANLTPYDMREKARLFLESIQSNFKIGFLFSKKKTEEEREQRLNILYDDLKERVDSQLQWHLQQYVQTFVANQSLEEESFIQHIRSFSIPLTKEDIQKVVKPGASVSGDYVLTYTNDLAAEVKKRAERQLNDLFAIIVASLNELHEKKRQSVTDSMNDLQALQHAMQRINSSDQYLQNKEAQLREIVYEEKELTEEQEKQLLTDIQDTYTLASDSDDEVVLQVTEEKENQLSVREHKNNSGTSIEVAIDDIEVAVKSMKPFKQLHPFVKQLVDKKERLKQQSFTVALFGAFSAGKSSFANALIGESVLPVSPNPTTATINKIVPPTKEHPHQTATIHIKTEAELLEDIKVSLSFFAKNANSMAEALEIIKSITVAENSDVREKLHLSFLHAVVNGYEVIKESLGSSIATNMNQFRQYVVQEEKACFVQFIDLYYDCELTRKGITLVDTPGADSINARHTGVAFDYIKNADAILFVTYYNHAFSKADREFLIQLGRVKDVFTLDKMFFLINAADLASSDEELQLVTQYVQDQLGQYGIRFPRLYPISSLLALKEKSKSRFLPFEKDFYQFISYELTEIATSSAYGDIKRGLNVSTEVERLQTKSASEKELHIKQLQEKQEKMTNLIASVSDENEREKLQRELKELLYYVKQRVMIRYYDFFKESFNPASLRDDKGNKQEQLQACLQELLESIVFDSTQEVRATTLRGGKYVHNLAKEVHELLMKKAHQIDVAFAPSVDDMNSDDGSKYMNAMAMPDPVQFKKVLSLYKNNKSFFEKNEKEKMVEQLKKMLEPTIDTYLAAQEQLLTQYYTASFSDYIMEYKGQMKTQCDDYYAGLQESLTNPFDLKELQATITTLKQLIKN